MDDCAGKRAIDGGLLSRKGSGLALRGTSKSDKNAKLCNRRGCSGSVNSSAGVQKDCSEKGKSLRTSNLSSSSGKVIGTSSRAYSGTSNPRKLLKERTKTISSHLETNSTETSTVESESEILEITPYPEKIQRGLPAVSEIAGSSNASVLEVGSSSVLSKKGSNNFNQGNGLQSEDSVAGSCIPSGSRSTGQMTHAGSKRYGLKNFRCNSISDVFPPVYSSSDSNLNKRKNIIKKVNHDGESSSAVQGKKIIGSTLEGRNVSSRNGISITESRCRNTPPNRDSTTVTTLRTKRANSGQTRARLSNQGNDNSVSLNGDPFMISPYHPDDHNTVAPLIQVSSDAPIGHLVSYGRPRRSREHAISPTSPVEFGINHNLIVQDNIRRYHMDGIAEVLLALERIELDEELTHEEILVLETNLLLNSLTFHDQHRDLRLDIDNMSYEELLALEERMGNVSTALTEEALAESLEKGVYQSELSNDEIEGCHQDGDDDNKCSICQEEYVVGDEVGSLQCEHRYHVDCIQHWLRLKNWCPTCKASAAPSKSDPPS